MIKIFRSVINSHSFFFFLLSNDRFLELCRTRMTFLFFFLHARDRKYPVQETEWNKKVIFGIAMYVKCALQENPFKCVVLIALFLSAI